VRRRREENRERRRNRTKIESIKTSFTFSFTYLTLTSSLSLSPPPPPSILHTSSIRVRDRFDAVTNAEDEGIVLTHLIDELLRGKRAIDGVGELQSRSIQGTSEPIALEEKRRVR